jgi:hypothetical protein
MSSAEYGQLVEFLGRQFTAVDRRFAEMDRGSRQDSLTRRAGAGFSSATSSS